MFFASSSLKKHQ